MTTLNQIHKRVRRDRDRQVVAEMALRFDRAADRAFIEGRHDDSAELRDAAATLLSVPLKQATAFLGVLHNSKVGESVA